MNNIVKKETIRMISNIGKFLPILVFIIPGITYSSESAQPVDENGVRPNHQILLEKYDADGDGVLSEQEKETLREARRQARLERFDTDGDGVLSDEEKSAARDAMKEHLAERRQHMLERFDTDGDGELSENEREAARQARKERRDSNR